MANPSRPCFSRSTAVALGSFQLWISRGVHHCNALYCGTLRLSLHNIAFIYKKKNDLIVLLYFFIYNLFIFIYYFISSLLLLLLLFYSSTNNTSSLLPLLLPLFYFIFYNYIFFFLQTYTRQTPRVRTTPSTMTCNKKRATKEPNEQITAGANRPIKGYYRHRRF